MTPEQALEMLDKLASEISTNRLTHVKLQEAVECLREFIKNKNGK